MQITIDGGPGEIANLVLAVQDRWVIRWNGLDKGHPADFKGLENVLLARHDTGPEAPEKPSS